MYCIKQRKYLKQLKKYLDNPNQYYRVLQKFYKLYKSERRSFSEERTKKSFDELLEKKCLRKENDIITQLQKERNIIDTDNIVIQELRGGLGVLGDRIKTMELLIITYQEKMKMNMEDMNSKVNAIKHKVEIKTKRKYNRKTTAKINGVAKVSEVSDIIIKDKDDKY